MKMKFLPVSRADMQKEGIEQLDFIYVTGDAYVDHPSFGSAIITRLLEQYGYTVGVIAQPDWKDEKSITKLGEPRLGFLVSSGNMDSMVNHYTVSKKPRSQDAYSPGGRRGFRPDRAVVVYGNLIRRVYKDTPVIVGGIEASLRRMAHYDYWSDKVKRSILLDSGADIISYGMGEHSVLELAEGLSRGLSIQDITYVPGTVYRTRTLEHLTDPVILPDYQAVLSDKQAYAKSFLKQYQNTDPFTGKTLVEDYGTQGYIVQNPPSQPLTTDEMDNIYSLPYTRTYHPMYNTLGGIPAIEEVKFSLTSNRGCFGSCNFCALTFHQGRIVQTRSHSSLLEEAREYTKATDFKGYIHDVGGPTADFRQPACQKQLKKGACPDKQCLFPQPCRALDTSHKDYVELLRKLRSIPKVKKVFIRSGIRFDYVMADSEEDFIRELTQHHISGQLRVAPEHVSDKVLRFMGKPSHEVYRSFLKKCEHYNQLSGKKQYVLPYLMSSHPGCSLKEAVELAEYVHEMGFMPEQVQDFYPTPSTLSTCMYYTGIDPLSMKSVYVPRTTREKAMQRALLQYRIPQNYELVKEALLKAGRADLIGFEAKCLIRPRGGGNNKSAKGTAPARKQLAANGRSKRKTIRNVHKKKGTK